MNKLKTLQTDLNTAQDTLKALQDELPQFHALLADNEQAAETLRRERGDLSKQAEAKGRVNVAREMLEQHQSDIQTAQAEVSRLEQNAAREQRLEQMTAHAKTANEHRTAVEKAVEGAVADLLRASQTIIREWAAFETARADFVAVGAEETGTTQWLGDPSALGLHGPDGQRLKERATAILDSLKTRDASLSGLLEQETTYIRYRIDYNASETPTGCWTSPACVVCGTCPRQRADKLATESAETKTVCYFARCP